MNLNSPKHRFNTRSLSLSGSSSFTTQNCDFWNCPTTFFTKFCDVNKFEHLKKDTDLLYLAAGVNFSPHCKNHPRGRAGKKKINEKCFSEKIQSAKKDSFSPLPVFVHCQTRSAFAQNQNVVDSQSESSTENPQTSLNSQKRARKSPRTS